MYASRIRSLRSNRGLSSSPERSKNPGSVLGVAIGAAGGVKGTETEPCGKFNGISVRD